MNILELFFFDLELFFKGLMHFFDAVDRLFNLDLSFDGVQRALLLHSMKFLSGNIVLLVDNDPLFLLDILSKASDLL